MQTVIPLGLWKISVNWLWLGEELTGAFAEMAESIYRMHWGSGSLGWGWGSEMNLACVSDVLCHFLLAQLWFPPWHSRQFHGHSHLTAPLASAGQYSFRDSSQLTRNGRWWRNECSSLLSCQRALLLYLSTLPASQKVHEPAAGPKNKPSFWLFSPPSCFLGPSSTKPSAPTFLLQTLKMAGTICQGSVNLRKRHRPKKSILGKSWI